MGYARHDKHTIATADSRSKQPHARGIDNPVESSPEQTRSDRNVLRLARRMRDEWRRERYARLKPG